MNLILSFLLFHCNIFVLAKLGRMKLQGALSALPSFQQAVVADDTKAFHSAVQSFRSTFDSLATGSTFGGKLDATLVKNIKKFSDEFWSLIGTFNEEDVPIFSNKKTMLVEVDELIKKVIQLDTDVELHPESIEAISKEYTSALKGVIKLKDDVKMEVNYELDDGVDEESATLDKESKEELEKQEHRSLYFGEEPTPVIKKTKIEDPIEESKELKNSIAFEAQLSLPSYKNENDNVSEDSIRLSSLPKISDDTNTKDDSDKKEISEVSPRDNNGINNAKSMNDNSTIDSTNPTPDNNKKEESRDITKNKENLQNSEPILSQQTPTIDATILNSDHLPNILNPTVLVEGDDGRAHRVKLHIEKENATTKNN